LKRTRQARAQSDFAFLLGIYFYEPCDNLDQGFPDYYRSIKSTAVPSSSGTISMLFLSISSRMLSSESR